MLQERLVAGDLHYEILHRPVSCMLPLSVGSTAYDGARQAAYETAARCAVARLADQPGAESQGIQRELRVDHKVQRLHVLPEGSV